MLSEYGRKPPEINQTLLKVKLKGLNQKLTRSPSLWQLLNDGSDIPDDDTAAATAAHHV